MAQFSTDFSGYTTGAQPSDWTERWATTSGSGIVTSIGAPAGGGTKQLKIVTTSEGSNPWALSWNAPGTPSGDVDVLAKLYNSAGNGNDRWIACHGSGTSSPTGFVAFTDTTDASFNLYNLPATQVGSVASFPDFDTWHWFRIQRTGTTIRAKWWLDGDVEPDTWQVSGTQSSPTSGWVGVGAWDSGVRITTWCSFFSVGTNGDAAPGENSAPTASAGADQSVTEGDNVSLSGTGSDPDGDSLIYAWAVTDDGGTGLTSGDLTDADTATPSFTAPSVVSAANIGLTLTVTDTGSLTGTDTVTITVNPANVLTDVIGSGGLLAGGAAEFDEHLINIALSATGAGGVLVGSATVVDPSIIDILLNLTGSGGPVAGGSAPSEFVKTTVQPVESITTTPEFEVSLVARTPAASGAPTLAEVDRLVVDSIQYTDELNRPGSATLGVPIGTMSSAVKARLADLALHPCEVRIYYDSAIVWAGELQTIAIDGQTAQLGCVGLLGYVYRMGIDEDLTYTGEDQFAIVKALVDHWQDKDYGNFGLDTSGIGTSGVTLDRTYLQSDLNNVGAKLEELSESSDGFDMYVDPDTRELVLSYPTRGTDLSETVVLDERSIDSAQIAVSVGPDDLVTFVSANGTSQDATGGSVQLYTGRISTTERTTYGLSWNSATFDSVVDLDDLTNRANEFLLARNDQLLQPGATLFARPGTRPGDFSPGDTVSYSFDAGLGRQSGTYRVASVGVAVDGTGALRLTVGFT